MKREAYDALADVPGTVLKPRAKRDKSEGRQTPGSTLTTYVKLKPVNKERAAQARAEDFGEQARACKEIGICCCCGREGETDPHHYISRGAGGSDKHCVPLLRDCHRRVHAIGAKRFWLEAAVDPAEVAYGMAEWVKVGCPRGRAPVRKR